MHRTDRPPNSKLATQGKPSAPFLKGKLELSELNSAFRRTAKRTAVAVRASGLGMNSENSVSEPSGCPHAPWSGCSWVQILDIDIYSRHRSIDIEIDMNINTDTGWESYESRHLRIDPIFHLLKVKAGIRNLIMNLLAGPPKYPQQQPMYLFLGQGFFFWYFGGPGVYLTEPNSRAILPQVFKARNIRRETSRAACSAMVTWLVPQACQRRPVSSLARQ